jgi:hypothetical protein
MFEGLPKTESPWRPLWPDVSDVAGAQKAIELGYWGAFALAGLTTLVSVFGVMGASRRTLLAAVVFGLLGLGIWRKWRSAAVLGFVLFTAIAILRDPQTFGAAVFPAVFALGAVRGTFAYHRLIKNQP